jgi:hypothetical protein
MGTMITSTRRRWGARAGIAAAAALGMAVMTTAPADAIGDYKVVYRSCGSNWIASGGSGDIWWAQTTRNSGNCSGILGVALQSNDGYITPRVNGTSNEAFTRISGIHAVNGLHWGCLSCSVSTT